MKKLSIAMLVSVLVLLLIPVGFGQDYPMFPPDFEQFDRNACSCEGFQTCIDFGSSQEECMEGVRYRFDDICKTMAWMNIAYSCCGAVAEAHTACYGDDNCDRDKLNELENKLNDCNRKCDELAKNVVDNAELIPSCAGVAINKTEPDKFYILDKTELDFPDINYQQTVDGIYTGIDPYVYKFRNIVEYTDTSFYSNPDEWKKITIYDPIMVYFYVFHSDKEAKVGAQYGLKLQTQYGLKIEKLMGEPVPDYGYPLGSSNPPESNQRIPCELHEENEDGNVWKCTTTFESLYKQQYGGSTIKGAARVMDDKGQKLEAESSEIIVAKWLFSVITDGNFGNIVRNMKWFVDFSKSQRGLVETYQDSLQYPHASYKIIYYKDTISFTPPLYSENLIMPNSFIDGITIIVSDSIIHNQNIIESISAAAFAHPEKQKVFTGPTLIPEYLAHEIGHVFGLCDEYFLSFYVSQDTNYKWEHLSRDDRKRMHSLLSVLMNFSINEAEKARTISEVKSIINGLSGGCPNPFPPCCEAGSIPLCAQRPTNQCFGMPKNYPSSVSPPYSIMSNNQGPMSSLWYPQGSVCPLKDCRSEDIVEESPETGTAPTAGTRRTSIDTDRESADPTGPTTTPFDWKTDGGDNGNANTEASNE